MAGQDETLKHIYRVVNGILMLCALVAVYGYTWLMRINPLVEIPFDAVGSFLIICVYLCAVLIFLALFSGFQIGIARASHLLLGNGIALGIVDGVGFIFTLLLIRKRSLVFHALGLYIRIFLLDVCILFICISIGTRLYRNFFPPYQMLEIFGSSENGFADKMNLRADKYSVTDRMRYDVEMNELSTTISRYDAILVSGVPPEARNRILTLCFTLRKRVYFTPDIPDILVREAEELDLFDAPLYLSRNPGFSSGQRIVKRTFDIIFSVIGIVLASPVMLCVALSIKLYDGGNILYRQKRYTLHRREFQMLKFRSMVQNAEHDGKARLASVSDERITRIGRFIRATRIDELPQLFNILKGDMSFVGPRPERPELHIDFCQSVPEFEFRLSVKAGLTGYAQVYGRYNTTKYDKLKYDMIYVQRASLLLDLRLMLLTLRVILEKETSEGVEEID